MMAISPGFLLTRGNWQSGTYWEVACLYDWSGTLYYDPTGWVQQLPNLAIVADTLDVARSLFIQA
jgi:hypothetical protein